MKVLLLCTCILIAIQSSTSSELRQQLQSAVRDIRNDAQTCLTENEMTGEQMLEESEIMTNVHTEPKNEQRVRKHGCVIACILKKQDLMENSNIKEAKIHEMITQQFAPEVVSTAHKIARKCLKEVKIISDECEKGFSLYACVAKAVHIVAEHDEHKKEKSEEEEEEHLDCLGTNVKSLPTETESPAEEAEKAE